MKPLAVSQAAPPLFLRPAPSALNRRLGRDPDGLVQRLLRRYLGRAYWPADADIQFPVPPAWPPTAAPRQAPLRLDIRLIRPWSAAPARTGARLTTLSRTEPAHSRAAVVAGRPLPDVRDRRPASPGGDVGSERAKAGLMAADIRILRQTIVERAGVMQRPERASGDAGSSPATAAAPAMTVIRTPRETPSPSGLSEQSTRTDTAPDAAARREAALDHPTLDHPAPAERGSAASPANEAQRPAAWRAPETRPTRLTLRRRPAASQSPDRRVLARRGPPARPDFSPVIPRVARTGDAAGQMDLARPELAPARPAPTPAVALSPPRSAPLRPAPLEVRRNPQPALAPAAGQTSAGPRTSEPVGRPGAARPGAAQQAPARSTPAANTTPARPELDVPALRRALNRLPVQDIAPLADRLFEHFERHVRRGLERRGRL